MVCLVDNSNIINISYAVFVKTLKDKNGPDYVIKESDLGMFWHLYVHKIKDYLTTYKELVFCSEGHNSTVWRKNKYPLYKENRKERAENPDYNFIKKCYEDCDKFLKLFHCKVMRVENCEADDVIYKLTEYYTSKGEEVNIVSSDKDLTQMCSYFDGVSVFNPMSNVNKRITPVTNSENCNKNIILEKAIVGDSSDNIKGLPGIGQKTFEKMLEDKILWNKKMTQDNQILFETILDIVDLRRYPKEYQDEIIKQFESFDFYNFDVQGVEKFYFDNNLNQCAREWSQLSADIEMMLNGKAELSAEEEILAMING